MKVLAIIPARGGSKGIPNKNIVNFKGKPLIHWSLEAALHSSFITDIVVSSDNEKILKVAAINKEIQLHLRPDHLAKDDTRTEPVIDYVLQKLNNYIPDYIVLLQPTSPLRTAQDIDNASEKLLNSNANAIISVTGLEIHPYKTFKITENNYLEGIINNEYPFYPRQKLPNVVKPNGAIYIIKTSDFLKNNRLFTERTAYYKMSQKSSLDIDSPEDLK